MIILNPIYDTVFKYLMEDIEIAKGLISTIIEMDVLELIPAPQEQTSSKVKIKYARLEIQHLDYVAHIKTIDEKGKEHYERVMLEVQKSPFAPALGRFRKYLAEKYKSISLVKTEKGQEKKYLPIKTIYLIEETFNENLPAILKRNSQYLDVLTRELYTGEKDNFVEALTHEAWFIQLSKLPQNLQNTITSLLSVFTPWFREKTDERFVNYPIEEADLDKIKNQILKRILRRLRGAVDNDNLKLAMEIEIEYEDFIEQQIAEKERYKEEAGVERKAKEEKEKQLKKERAKIIETVREMKKHGMDIDIIMKVSQLTKEEVEKL